MYFFIKYVHFSHAFEKKTSCFLSDKTLFAAQPSGTVNVRTGRGIAFE